MATSTVRRQGSIEYGVRVHPGERSAVRVEFDVSLSPMGLAMILHAVTDEYHTLLSALTARHGISNKILFAAVETALSATRPTSPFPAGRDRLVSRPAWFEVESLSDETKLGGVDI